MAGLTLRPVPRGDLGRARAEGVLLTGRDAPRDPSVEAFGAYTREAGLDTSRLWAAWEGDKPVAAALAMPAPGRTAMLLVSPIRTPRVVPAACGCVAASVAALPAEQIGLVQCLLELEQLYEQSALASAGFTVLARLMYMQHDLSTEGAVDGPSELPGVSLPGKEAELLTWRDDRRDLFAQAVLASYEDTRDCPGLVGTRGIDDILAGHRGTGAFDPALWTVVTVGDVPVAVLMLAGLPQRDAVELVYLGVGKAARGHGLARQLLRRGIAQAARRRAERMLLAVDEQNVPAVSLYRGVGFRTEARRTAMVRFLPV